LKSSRSSLTIAWIDSIHNNMEVTMKCVKKDNKIVRVSNERAAELVEKAGYTYTDKDSWKRQERKNEATD